MSLQKTHNEDEINNLKNKMMETLYNYSLADKKLIEAQKLLLKDTMKLRKDIHRYKQEKMIAKVKFEQIKKQI